MFSLSSAGLPPATETHPLKLLASRQLSIGLLGGILAFALPALVSDTGAYLKHLVNSDFRIYYAAAQLGQRHGWASLYDPTLQKAAVTALWPGSRFLPFVNPPELAWAVAPATLLPYPAAYAIAIGVALLAVVGAAFVMPGRGVALRAAYLVSAVAFEPALVAVVFANVVAFFPLLLLAGWRLLEARRDWVAGAVLGATVLKPQLVLLLPLVLLASGRWRTTLAWAAVSGAILGAGALGVGSGGVVQFWHLLHQVSTYHNQQANTPFYWLGQGAVAWAADIAFLLLALRAGWAWRASGVALPMAAGLLGSILVSHYLNGIDFLVLLVAVWLIVASHVPLHLKAAAGLTWIGADVYQFSVLFPLLAAAVTLFAIALGPQVRVRMPRALRLDPRIGRLVL